MSAFLYDIHYPSYAELPDELVFLDDVVEVINRCHAPLPPVARNGKAAFTKAMASNYVKAKLTAPAVGKKYGREHIARILFASTLKLAYSAEDVLALTHAAFGGRDCRAAHDEIAAELNRLFAEAPRCSVAENPSKVSLACATVVLKIASLTE